MLAAALSLFAVAEITANAVHGQRGTAAAPRPSVAGKRGPGGAIRVLALGSSVAKGWDDKTGGGYLARAVSAYAGQSGYDYQLVNRAQAGDWAGKVLPEPYTKWLNEIRPQIVLISWGALDDAYHKTPIPVFRAAVAKEIQMALDRHAVVFIVTPPVTKASYTQYRTVEPLYLNNEMQVARSFHSPNVFVFDVFDQMKAYIAGHHLNYMQFQADGWHPNAAGHTLAGKILAQDMLRRYGDGPIRYRSATDPAARAQVQ